MSDDPDSLPERIQALIAKWRDAAVWEHDDMSNVQSAQTFDQCANDLEALLAPSRPDTQEPHS